MKNSVIRALLPLSTAVIVVPTAQAHSSIVETMSVLSGLLHPLSGVDHCLAMLAVGFWSAHLGGCALTRLPLAFLVAMLAGMGMGLAGFFLPMAEAGIIASVLLIGLVLLFSLRLPLYLGVPLVGLFAVFHGHAHGWEMPISSSALWFALGTAMTTAALIYTGIGAGAGLRAWAGDRALPIAGALTVSSGLLFLT